MGVGLAIRSGPANAEHSVPERRKGRYTVPARSTPDSPGEPGRAMRWQAGWAHPAHGKDRARESGVGQEVILRAVC
jgi:hypothetical protein